MIKRVNVTISDKLDAEEWKSIKAFCKRAAQLANTKLLKSGESGIQGKIRYEENKGLWFEGVLPTEEQIAEFLMAFRFFYLQKERTYLPKILKILGKHTSQEELRQALKIYRQLWDQELFGNAMQLTLNNKKITASDILDLWFNAHYFHSDEDKSKELEKLTMFFSNNFSKVMLLDTIYEKTRIIFRLYEGLRGLVEKEGIQP